MEIDFQKISTVLILLLVLYFAAWRNDKVFAIAVGLGGLVGFGVFRLATGVPLFW